jgi:MFS family permease
VVALAVVMDLMDATILTIALPTIQRTMHASDTAVHWMAAAYTLAFALLRITGGRLGDVSVTAGGVGPFGHRSFSLGLVISLLLFASLSGFALTFSLLLQLGQGFSAIHAVVTALFITAGMVPVAGTLSKKVIDPPANSPLAPESQFASDGRYVLKRDSLLGHQNW